MAETISRTEAISIITSHWEDEAAERRQDAERLLDAADEFRLWAERLSRGLRPDGRPGAVTDRALARYLAEIEDD